MHLSLPKAALDTFVTQLAYYCNNDLSGRWRSLEDRLHNGKSIDVANAGMFKAGKSSLFNALLENIETERFPTGAAPVTHSLDRQEWIDGIFLVDTPGIGTDNMDEEQAIKSYQVADVIIFVHNMRMGDYQREECEFITKIRDALAASCDIRERFLFVGSRLDEIQGTRDESEILRRMQEQLTQIFGCEMPIYAESATRYIKGKREHKDGFIKSSGFSALRAEILRRASAARLYKDESLSYTLEFLQRDTIAMLHPVQKQQHDDIHRAEYARDAEIREVVFSLNKFCDNYRGRLHIIQRKQSSY